MKPVIVDMFCGAGGESCGIRQAAENANIDIRMYAINHWQQAIETHQANFPEDEEWDYTITQDQVLRQGFTDNQVIWIQDVIKQLSQEDSTNV